MLKCRSFLINFTTRNLVTSSILRDEEMPKRFDQEVPSFKPLSEIHTRKIEEDKRKLEWRKGFKDMPGFYKSKLNMFNNEEVGPSALEMIAQPIDVSAKGVKRWWANFKVRKEKYLQQYIPERHDILGNDLAAAHFLLFRKGKVKFCGHKDWMELDEDHTEVIPLPNMFDPTYELEAIKCDDMELYYEGLENIRRLKKLKYLSFRNVKLFDDWGMDRVSGSEFDSLETLDITGTSVTANGLQALYRMPSLRKLIADEQPKENIAWHLTVAMIQDIHPHFEVVS